MVKNNFVCCENKICLNIIVWHIGEYTPVCQTLRPLTGEVKNNDHQSNVLLGNPGSQHSGEYHYSTLPHPNSVEDKSTPPHDNSTTQW